MMQAQGEHEVISSHNTSISFFSLIKSEQFDNIVVKLNFSHSVFNFPLSMSKSTFLPDFKYLVFLELVTSVGSIHPLSQSIYNIPFGFPTQPGILFTVVVFTSILFSPHITTKSDFKYRFLLYQSLLILAQ